MSLTPYIQVQLKELDRVLNLLPRRERVRALEVYRLGLERSFSTSYPNKVPRPAEVEGLDKLSEIIWQYPIEFGLGTNLGLQFGSLEVESARETILAEVEKKKAKFSKPALWDFSRFFRR